MVAVAVVVTIGDGENMGNTVGDSVVVGEGLKKRQRMRNRLISISFLIIFLWSSRMVSRVN